MDQHRPLLVVKALTALFKRLAVMSTERDGVPFTTGRDRLMDPVVLAEVRGDSPKNCRKMRAVFVTQSDTYRKHENAI